MQDGEDNAIAAPGEGHDWVISSLAAKQMTQTVDAYAVKKAGSTIFADGTLGVSVKGYVEQDPASTVSGEVASTLAATLETMMIYGKYAEKFFGGDATEISGEELAAIGVGSVPATTSTFVTANSPK